MTVRPGGRPADRLIESLPTVLQKRGLETMIYRRRSSAALIPIGIVVVVLVFFLASPARAEIATGPKVGTKIPDIQAYDQHGKLRTFEDLCGPEGLLVLFYRTADW